MLLNSQMLLPHYLRFQNLRMRLTAANDPKIPILVVRQVKIFRRLLA
jgi:hypothetical protein